MKSIIPATAVTMALLGSAPLGKAYGADVPTAVNVQGVLRDSDGVVMSGNYDMTFTLYTSADGGSEDEVTGGTMYDVPVDGGVFSVYLGSDAGLGANLLASYTDLYIGIQVEGFADELEPRIPLAAQPYALQSEHANSCDLADWSDLSGNSDLLDGYDWSAFQLRVTGECGTGYAISSIDEYGNVSCTALTYSGSNPITVGGGEIGLSSAGCSAGYVWMYDGSSWECTSVEYAGTEPIHVSGNKISLSTSWCATAGYVMKWAGTYWTCAYDKGSSLDGRFPIGVESEVVFLEECGKGQIYRMSEYGDGWECADPAPIAAAKTTTTYGWLALSSSNVERFAGSFTFVAAGKAVLNVQASFYPYGSASPIYGTVYEGGSWVADFTWSSGEYYAQETKSFTTSIDVTPGTKTYSVYMYTYAADTVYWYNGMITATYVPGSL